MMDELRPTGIKADRTARQMTVNWSDGHTSVYSFSLLRNACPCAECRGGHANMSSEPNPDVFLRPDVDTPATRLEQVEAVGSYGMTIGWEDGHHYGIYTWKYLRALCPCPDCRGE